MGLLLLPAQPAARGADRLCTELQKALKQPDVKARLAQQGFDGYGMTSAQFAAFFPRHRSPVRTCRASARVSAGIQRLLRCWSIL